jgi:uncharacterized protein
LSFAVKEYELVSGRIRRPLSVVLLADLHNTEHGKDSRDLIDAVRSCRPDLILCAGDMLVARPGTSFRVASEFLKRAAEIAPVYFSNGNHESKVREQTQSFGDLYGEYTENLRAAGVRILNNAHEDITVRDNELQIFGLEIDCGKYRRFTYPTLTQEEMELLLGKPDPAKFSVLLAHNPEFAPAYRDWGADLTVSGHFHGGVARLRNGRALFSPYGRMLPRYGYGKYIEKGRCLIVTSGAGEHVIPFRINNPMEMVHINLR